MSRAAVALFEAYGIVASAEAARELGVLERLAKAPATAADTARALKLDPGAMGELLLALSSVGVVDVDDDGLFSARVESAELVDAMRFWNGLGARLVAGTTALGMERAEAADEHYPAAVRWMTRAIGAAADDAAALLAGAGSDVLDVGAGAATWSLALAQRDPRCRLRLLDQPRVLDVARARVMEAGLEDRFTFEVADIGRDDFGRQCCDLVIVGNVCHLFGERQNVSLMARAFAALRPGGTLAVIEATPEDYASMLSARLHAMSLLVRTTEGDVHSFNSYCAWIRRAGFRGIERARIGGFGAQQSVIRARRPDRPWG